MGKNKNINNSEFKTEDSTIFFKPERSKPDDEAAMKKPKRKARIAFIIFVAAVVLLVGVPWLVVTIVGSPNSNIINNGKPKHSYEQLLEHTKATEESAELFAMKNPDITDSEAVTALIAYLHPENELGGYSVEIQSAERPYYLTLRFELVHNTGDESENEWKISVIKYSCAVMALVSDISEVKWEFPTETGAVTGSGFTRADAEKLMNLGVPVTRFAESETSVQLLLNQLGIDLY